MAKCPYCGNELERYDDNRQYCARCNKYFSVKQNAAPAANSQGSENNEIAELKARIATLEAGKQSNASKLRMNKTALLASPAWTWFKKYGKIILPSILVLIIFITLMVCLVGIRGIYVNVNNPNEFYSFTATNYEYHGSSVMGDYVDKGTWKVKGNTLYLTYKDPDFGVTVTDDYEFVNQSNKTLIIDGDFGVEKTFKRISLINYSALAKKVKITFDPGKGSVQGSSSPFTAKVKAGNKIPAPEATREGYTFLGWYKSPDFKPEELFDENDAQWENATYYAKYYNPTEYKISIVNTNIEIIAHENDSLLSVLNSTENGSAYNYFRYNWGSGSQIDGSALMPEHDIQVKRIGKQFTASFDVNGGIGNAESVQFQFDGSTYNSPEFPTVTKEGYIFKGWLAQDSDELFEWRVPTKFPNDITFVAQFIDPIDLMTFELIDGGYSLTNFDKSQTTHYHTVQIPDSFNDTPVISIGDRAFYNYYTWLTGITIPDSVTSIGEGAFYNCSRLTSVTIGNSVTSIGDWAFSGCSGLTSITIPDSMTSIGEDAFYDCSGLTTVNWNATSYTTAGSFNYPIFSDCTNLTTVNIGDNVTIIPAYVFDGRALTSITVEQGNLTYHSAGNCLIESATKTLILGCKTSIIPTDGSVTSIGEGAFAYCSGLTSITIPDSVTSIGESAFSGCSGLASITIPDSVTSIGERAFYDCSSLTSVTIGNSVTSIGEGAFAYCSGLTSITIPDRVTSIGEGAFSGCSGLVEMTIPFVGGSRKTASDTYQYPFGYIFGTSSYTGGTATEQYYYGSSTSSLTSTTYYIPTSLKKVTVTGGNILYGAFRNCSMMSITIPDSVTSIGESAFYGCSGLTSITIPDNVTSIGKYAFTDCSGLTSITIPDSVTSIGEYAFYRCSGLTSITILDNVTSIGKYAFTNCSGLTSVIVEQGNSTYHSVNNCLIESATKTLILGCKNSIIPTDGSVTSIGEYAFSGCSGLTSITIPNSVTSIGDGAFDDCSGLTSITIPDSVTSIGEDAFYACSGLTSITIPDSVTSIGERAFNDCYRLTSVTIGNSVTSIGESAFAYCSGLTSITIPDSVTSIGKRAFSGCRSLENIYCKAPSKPGGWSSNWYGNCTAQIVWGYEG